MPPDKNSDIAHLKLNIPRLWEHDWRAAIEGVTGACSLILTFEARAAYLLNEIRDLSLNFERLAWISLWTKTFSILEGTQAAINQKSQYLLEILYRTSFELQLQATTITQGSTTDRLRAYAAWCLWNDIIYQKEFLDPRTLNGIWDPEPAKRLILDPRRREHEELFGPIDVETDYKELRKGRLLQQNSEQFKLRRLSSWLGHPDLSRWSDKLKCLDRERKGKSITFFALFNKSEKSVAKRLHALKMRFAYLAYQRGSMFVHGSTLEHLIALNQGEVTPL